MIFRFALPLLALAFAVPTPGADSTLLAPADFAHYAAHFHAMAPEAVVNVVPDAAAWDWLSDRIPLFTCSDPEVEQTYYFRWWSLRRHVVATPTGLALTEFLTRKDPISSAVGHHVMEGRWLRDPQLLDDYLHYWLHGGPDGAIHPKLHTFSGWLAHAVYSRYLVTGDVASATRQLDALVRDYAQWEAERLMPGGLYWQYDVRDAMEESISGSRTRKNLRPPLNSYQFGNATALAALARLADRADLAHEFDAKAAALRRLVEDHLWDPAARFFKVRYEAGDLSDAREEIGFIPWYFSLPEAGHGYEAAWAQFADDTGFRAPFGLTTAERRHPKFRTHGVGKCEWDGAVWPFATSQTLTALANLLDEYPAQSFVTSRDWFEAFHTYVRSQQLNGEPFIGEYLDEKTGAWINRGDRSRDYNHSTFADLVITGLVGLRPRPDDVVNISPLLPPGTWDWFCLDGVRYHGQLLTIIWDRTGEKFHRGTGFTLLDSGKTLAHSAQLVPLSAKLP